LAHCIDANVLTQAFCAFRNLILNLVKMDPLRQAITVFEYLGCYWHRSQCMPNRHKPIGNTEETLVNRYETQARLQKMRDAGYKVISVWGCEFRKHLCDNPDHKNELCSQPYVKYSTVNIRDDLYGGGTETTKTHCRVKQGKKSIMWML